MPSMNDRHGPPHRSALRRFGLVMAGALGLLGALALWRGRPAAPWLLGVGGAFLLAALAAPALLRPLERAWMALARVLQAVVTTVLLVLTFYLVITPLGLIMRLVGHDPLGLKSDADADTYWVPIDREGSHSRPDKPY